MLGDIIYVMTNYQRLRITGPRDAFDEIAEKEKVYVEDRSRDELVVILELGGENLPDEPVKEAIREKLGTLKDYECNGEKIEYQEELPEELRDTDEFEEEQSHLSPDGRDWSDEEIVRVLTVMQAVETHEETKAAKRDIVQEAQERIRKIYGEDLEHNFTDPEEITEEDVELTRDLLGAEGVEHRGKSEYKHENNSLAAALDYVNQRIQHSEDFLIETEDE